MKEVTNDPTLSGEENKQRQVDNAPEMSLDGQLVKLADRLYNVRDLNNPPPSWSKEKVDEYYDWGEKLLAALRGSNEDLELALQKLIDNHKSDSLEEDQILNKKLSPVPTKQDIIEGYHKGVETGATHMLIVRDIYDFDDIYDFFVFCYPDKDVNDIVKRYTAPLYYRVVSVYSIHLDITE